MSISTSDVSGPTLSMESMESYYPQYQSPVRIFEDEIKDVEMKEFPFKTSTHPSKLHVKGIARTFNNYRHPKRHLYFRKVKEIICCPELQCADMILFENMSAALSANRKGRYLAGNGRPLTMYWYTEPSPTISASEPYEHQMKTQAARK